MLVVPRAAMPRLLAAVRLELARLERVRREVGDDWPDDYDPNDIPLIEMALEALQAAHESGRDEVDLGGKPLSIMCQSLPGYAADNMLSLSAQEYEGLKRVYAQAPSASAGPFPTR